MIRAAALAAVLVFAAASTAAQPAGDAVERGRSVYQAANCGGCHTVPKGPQAAGGRALKTPFGTFRSPNITPDPQHGLGGWSLDQFRAALRKGVSPEGHVYYPSFPYTAFTLMTDQDIADLWAFLRTLEPVAQPDQPHELDLIASWRFPVRFWRMLYFDEGPFRPDPARDQRWNRGAYLVRALGHCGECHTPRNFLGARDDEMMMAGSPDGAEGKPVPNITPDPDTGIGKWSEGDIAFYLETAVDPGGDVAGGLMAEVIENSTRRLTDEDRRAIAAYLKSLPPIRNAIVTGK